LIALPVHLHGALSELRTLIETTFPRGFEIGGRSLDHGEANFR